MKYLLIHKSTINNLQNIIKLKIRSMQISPLKAKEELFAIKTHEGDIIILDKTLQIKFRIYGCLETSGNSGLLQIDNILINCGENGLQYIDLSTKLPIFEGFPNHIFSLCQLFPNNLFAAGAEDEIYIINYKTRELVHKFRMDWEFFYSLCYIKDRNKLWGAGEEGNIYIYDLSRMELENRRDKVHIRGISAMEECGKLKMITGGSIDCKINVWDQKDANLLLFQWLT